MKEYDVLVLGSGGGGKLMAWGSWQSRVSAWLSLSENTLAALALTSLVCRVRM